MSSFSSLRLVFHRLFDLESNIYNNINNNLVLGNLTIVIFYTEILIRKVDLWSFFMSEMSEQNHNSTFRVKISV